MHNKTVPIQGTLLPTVHYLYLLNEKYYFLSLLFLIIIFVLTEKLINTVEISMNFPSLQNTKRNASFTNFSILHKTHMLLLSWKREGKKHSAK